MAKHSMNTNGGKKVTRYAYDNIKAPLNFALLPKKMRASRHTGPLTIADSIPVTASPSVLMAERRRVHFEEYDGENRM